MRRQASTVRGSWPSRVDLGCATSATSPEASRPRAIIATIDQPTAAPTMSGTRSRVLTGYRPTGPLHVGHWAGNIENMLALQGDPARECFFFIADWHMLT